MAYPSRPTGQTQEEKLLYEILKKLDQLTKIIGASITTTTTTTQA